jgi:hypothetical protein
VTEETSTTDHPSGTSFIFFQLKQDLLSPSTQLAEMVEFIIVSDDEGDSTPHSPVGSTQLSAIPTSNLSGLSAVNQSQKRPYKLVLVDSRRCPQMPRPRYLPIIVDQEPFSDVARDSHKQSLDASCHKSAEPVRCPARIEDEDGDPDYEDVRPTKRRRTGEKKVPKKHGKLTAPDWDIVRNGGAGVGRSQNRPRLPGKVVSDRKEARDYVKKMTANVDWEDILKHVEVLRLNMTKEDAAGEADQSKPTVKSRRGPTQANRLKQYWQGVLTKSVLKMDVDCSK